LRYVKDKCDDEAQLDGGAMGPARYVVGKIFTRA